MKTKLKATVKLEMTYDADSKNYGDVETVEEMINLDKLNFEDDPMIFIDAMLNTGTVEIEIKTFGDRC